MPDNPGIHSRAANGLSYQFRLETSTTKSTYNTVGIFEHQGPCNIAVSPAMALRTLSAALVLTASLAAAVDVRGVEMDVGMNASISPSIDIARQRGPAIFNAVHDAMRQWGSSLHHNGMSFFLATMPEGVLLHHGSSSKDSPTEPEWLAYEIEHAEHFARPRGWHGRPGGPGRGGPGGGGPGEPGDKQHVLRADAETKTGWLHTYRALRPLHYLYVDGMGAGKTAMGTLDSQDLVLRGLSPETVQARAQEAKRRHEERKASKDKDRRAGPSGSMDEQQRAADLCQLVTAWGLQGVIRMETGFEIIQCDFADGLEQVQALRRTSGSIPGGPGGGPGGPGGPGLVSVEFLRGLAERYEGIGSHRTRIDYASMVSSYFFPLNLTNPDGRRPDLPRLVSASVDGLAAVRTHLAATLGNRSDTTAMRAVDWQDVTDMIVGRYADRLNYMATEVETVPLMASELDFLLDVYVDYGDDEADTDIDSAIGRCTNFYLGPVVPTTASDRLIHAALTAVMDQLCTGLFDARNLVRRAAAAESELDADVALADVVAVLRSLIKYLNWARFKRCPACGLGEVCAIPMWPMGTVEMYEAPRCSNGSDLLQGDNYWGLFGPGRGGGRGQQP